MLTARWLLLSLPLLAACDAGSSPAATRPPSPDPARDQDPGPAEAPQPVEERPPASLAPEAAAFCGRFAGEQFVLDLGQTLRGTLTIGRRGPFPAEASVVGGVLQGEFLAEGARYPFSARTEGDGLLLTADRRDFRLRRAPAPSREADDVRPGTYRGSLNGLPATLTLRSRGQVLEGEATTSDGYRYTLQAERTANGVRGSFGDPQSGRTLPLQLAAQPSGIELMVSAPGKPPAKVVFQRAEGVAEDVGGSARDAALVGTWIQGEPDGGLERATLQLNADGTYLYGTSRAQDDSSGTRSEAGQGQVIQGIWRTEDGILFTRPAELESWIRYAGYTREGSKLQLTFEDERVEAWLRKG